MAPYAIESAPHPELPDRTAYTLSSPADFSVTFVPDGGMVGCSMKHRGEELLGMRGGFKKYVESGSTFGIPLLAPWANRLVVNNFSGTELKLDGTPGVHPDGNGLPIHGLLAGCRDWVVVRAEADETGAYLSAQLEFDSQRPEFPAWPFPHRLTIDVTLQGTTVMISTTVTATAEKAVPVAVGWHPYFAPPGLPRKDWTLSRPFNHSIELDEQSVPTGEQLRVPVEVDTLGDPAAGGVVLDNLYAEVQPGTKAWLEGGSRRITLRYDSGYSYAVLFAPADQDLVAIEPMSAPTDPLAGHFPISVATPGEPVVVDYSIVVTAAGEDA